MGFSLAVVGANLDDMRHGPRPEPDDRAIRTVMFTDLVDSTRQRTTAGDDTVDRLLDLHHITAHRIAAEHRGTVVKDTGDGCLLVFGSVRSAINAALALQAEPGAGSFRIGIHAGDVRDDGDVRGEAVNAASRITALAGGGQILVSQVVRDLAGTIAAQIVEHGTFELRGFPRPWTLYVVRAAPSRPPWRLVLLGDGHVEHHGVVVEPLSTGRVTRLLGRVALAPGGRIERARLAFELWPDSSEAQARTNLRKLLHEIRTHDADSPLLDAASTHVSLAADVSVDVLEVRDAIDRGDGATVAGAYAADFLASCFDDWALAARDALRVAAIGAVEASAARSDDPAEALQLARAVMMIDPLREPGYRLAMGALVARGERAEALRTYHRCAELLQRELGVGPSPELVAVYEAIRGDTAAGGERDQRFAPAPHALVGRAAELAMLVEAWQDACRGSARVALVTGEPGIGKSRLAAELVRYASDTGATVATTRVYETAGRLPFGPVADWLRASALRPALGRLDPAWRREVARLVPDLIPDERPDREDDGGGRLLLFDALAAAISTRTPVLLVLDDLQWCDDDTVAFLGHLLHHAREAPLMVVTTARSVDLSARPTVTAFIHERARSEQLVTVELGPLDRASTVRLATSLPGGPVDDDEAQQWWAEAEGNPLFVVELARASRAGSRHTLPPTVRAVITERLAALSRDGREVAEMAATIGREFSADVLERATGRSDADLAEHLDELWRLGIIREHAAGYDFTHDKLREVLATGIGPARRRRLHRLVGEALAELHAGDLDTVSSTLAAHLAAADRHADALDAYRRAARHALDVFALDEAIDCFGGAVRSIAGLPHDADRDRAERDVLIELGVPLVQQKGYGSERVLANYERAAALSRRLGEPIDAAVLRGIGLAKLVKCEFGQSIELARQVLDGADGETVASVEGHYLLGVNESWRGRLVSAAQHLAAAIDTYDPDVVRQHLTRFAQDPRPVSEVRLALVRLWQGSSGEAAELFARARDHADATGHPATLLYVVTYRCIGAIEDDDVDAAEAALGELAAMLERHGEYTYFDETGRLMRAWLEHRRGRPGGLAALERAVDRWRDGEHRLHYTYGLRLLAEACAGAGRIDAGLDAVTQGITFGRQHDQRYTEAPLRLSEATLRRDAGDVEGARAALRAALDVAREQGNVLYERRAAQRLESTHA